MSSSPTQAPRAVSIGCLLDESGSMSSVKAETISAINLFVQQQKRIASACPFTLIKFNTVIHSLWTNIDVQNVPTLTEDDYNPDNGTALYDAMWAFFEQNRGRSDVIMVVLTDGEDNLSRHTQTEIKALVDKHGQSPYDWQFIYLSNDPTLSRQGEAIGIGNTSSSSNMSTDYQQLPEMMRALSVGISDFRNRTSNTISISAPMSTTSSTSLTSSMSCDVDTRPTLRRT